MTTTEEKDLEVASLQRALREIQRAAGIASIMPPDEEAHGAFAYIVKIAEEALGKTFGSPNVASAVGPTGADVTGANAMIAFVRARPLLVQEVERLVRSEFWKKNADGGSPWIAPKAYGVVADICLRAMKKPDVSQAQVKPFSSIDLSSPQIWYLVAREFQ